MDNINDDEKYIIGIFSNLMNQIGYNNLFMFGKTENSRYSIYKEESNWIFREIEDGWGVNKSYYTNLYNLCLDLIKKIPDNKKRDLCLRIFQTDTIIPRETDVLIFNRIRGCELDEKDFIKGKIVGQKKSENKSNHGSPWYDISYIVEGEDNKYYFGRYGNAIEGYFFKTAEDYVSHIFEMMESNQKKIKYLKKENEEYRKLISDIVVRHNEELVNWK